MSEIPVDIWKVWLREYGAAGAISLALRHGYTREDILRANREARAVDAELASINQESAL